MPTNKLINEKSPYLLQHAHNPVDWRPWSDETFALARAQNKPVFLSIGYATCHWCHVMEKDSFEDEEVAGYLNDTFICIKVDREERPDIDAVYMAACQMLTGSGGWPLNLFLNPDKKPFFAATYLPKRARFGRAGVIELCQQGLFCQSCHDWVEFDQQNFLGAVAKELADEEAVSSANNEDLTRLAFCDHQR